MELASQHLVTSRAGWGPARARVGQGPAKALAVRGLPACPCQGPLLPRRLLPMTGDRAAAAGGLGDAEASWLLVAPEGRVILLRMNLLLPLHVARPLVCNASIEAVLAAHGARASVGGVAAARTRQAAALAASTWKTTEGLLPVLQGRHSLGCGGRGVAALHQHREGRAGRPLRRVKAA
eukprot:CAMPEP_0197896436 /NCGR_PEP_ID=MMETSP1439-20131203/39882_1 /TAXON_ID=66791 /ORGANISM="Gonyaulax spinifera, Strain CCMP409" /LENGTH=178 /DNA_ID=CAMNT_0043516961 /DNA_START=418 /DNA_END=955 /DNA_ORIENTATION=-